MTGKLALALAMLVACSTPKKIPDLGSHRWGLVQIQGENLDSSPVFIQFDTAEHRFVGNAGCNRMSGNYVATGQSVTFEEVISTRMACLDNKANERENQLLRLLNNHAYAFDMNGAILQLKDSGKVVLQFKGL
jgi:heat shock protein HslJ